MVSAAALRYPLYLQYFFLEPAATSHLSTRYTTPIHAGCVALDGRGMLFCGDSGAGKSTLSWACARAGWGYVSDDATFLLHGKDERIVTGNCHKVRLRLPAAELFPEIAGLEPTPRAEGKPSIEFPTASLPHIRQAEAAQVDFIIFLNRNWGGSPELTPYPREKARSFMRQVLFGTPELLAVQYAAVERLLAAEVSNCATTASSQRSSVCDCWRGKAADADDRWRGPSSAAARWRTPAAWLREHNLGRGFWIFFTAAFFFDAGFSVYFFLFNLYLLDLHFNERAIGLIGGAMTLGSIAGTLPVGALARRFGLRPLLVFCFVAAPGVGALRAVWTAQPAQVVLALFAGMAMCSWGVSFLPTVASLTTEKNRPAAFSLIYSVSIGSSSLGAVICGDLPRWLARAGWSLEDAAIKRAILLGSCALAAAGCGGDFAASHPVGA